MSAELQRTPGRAPRVALVHDWLTGMRGGEKVLEVLCELFPDAELFTLLQIAGTTSPVIERMRRSTSFVQRLPLVARHYRRYLPLFPAAIEQFDLDGFDLVVSSSHCAAKAVVRPGRALHVCYCHTPMRYVWDQHEAYFGPARIGRTGSRLLRPYFAALARWDAAVAGRVDSFIANSQHVARRIRRYYNRDAAVVYPPVDTAFYHPDATEPDGHMLVVSALVPYKRVDLAIDACRQAGRPLRVVGQGPEAANLRRHAGPGVEFLGSVTDEEIRTLYRRSAAVILPGEEDFGIVPLEAQACGCPVVALARGGALETVIDGLTGVLVPEPTVEAMADGVRRIGIERFDAAVLRQHALRFSRPRFAAELRARIEETWEGCKTSRDAS
jgi:glycosyltransferase involved in cell wall biosynthesis